MPPWVCYHGVCVQSARMSPWVCYRGVCVQSMRVCHHGVCYRGVCVQSVRVCHHGVCYRGVCVQSALLACDLTLISRSVWRRFTRMTQLLQENIYGMHVDYIIDFVCFSEAKLTLSFLLGFLIRCYEGRV
jgi:hypothetical protein